MRASVTEFCGNTIAVSFLRKAGVLSKLLSQEAQEILQWVEEKELVITLGNSNVVADSPSRKNQVQGSK